MVSESRLNDLGYQFLSNKRFKEAIMIFKLSTEFYPNSSNTFDSLGEAYAASDDTKLAIASYQKAVELDANNSNSRMRLKKLKEQILHEPSK